MRMNRRQLVAGGLGALAMPYVSRVAHAQASTVRLGKQFGLPYLPQMVMEKLKLIEKHAAKEGLPALTTEWMQLAGPGALNDALAQRRHRHHQCRSTLACHAVGADR